MYIDFHQAKWAKWALLLVDSWSHAPDQIQLYPDQNKKIVQLQIAQLWPERQTQQQVIIAWLTKNWHDLPHMLTSAWLTGADLHCQFSAMIDNGTQKE